MDFNFKKLDLTEEEFQAGSAPKSKMIGVGPHELKITKATFKKMSDGDPTWGVYSLILSKGGIKTATVKNKDGKDKLVALDKAGNEVPMMYHNLLVPTQRVKYAKAGISSYGETFPFQRFREFMGGLGETVICDPSVLGKIVPKWFKDAGALEGETLNVEVGYSKMHIERRDGKFIIADREGKQAVDGEFENRKDAEDAAFALKKVLQDWPEIIKVQAKTVDEDDSF
jgi:hypothetical protein